MARLTLDDLDRLSRELAHLTRSGIALPDGLRAFAASTHRGTLKSLTSQVAQAMQQGKPLSQALAESNPLPPPDFIYLVRAGERSGQLETLLMSASDQARRMRRHRSALATAATYPFIVIIAALMIMFLLANTFLPQLSDIYRQLGAAQLPGATQFVFDIGYVLSGTSGVIILLLLVGCIVFLLLPSVRDSVYRGMLRIPGLDLLSALSDTTVAMRSLGVLLAGGVPLNEALHVARLTVWERRFALSLDQMARAAEKGQPTAPLLSSAVPSTAAWLYAEAERRGSLPEACDGIARYCEERFDRISVNSITVIEPVLIILLGLLMGFVVISCYLPLFMIPKIMGQG